MDLVLTGIHGIKAKARYLEKTPFARDMMGDVAMLIMERVKDRTLRGEDIEGHAFAPYSEGYKKWRQKKGYKAAPVDLNLTGHMLSAMTEEHNAHQAEVFFMGTQDQSGVSAPDKAFWNQEDRKFFGLSKDDEREIMRIVVDYYEKATGRRTLR